MVIMKREACIRHLENSVIDHTKATAGMWKEDPLIVKQYI